MSDINRNNLNDIIGEVSKQAGVNSDTIKNGINSGSIDKVLSGLKPSDAKKLQEVLNNKAALNKLMQTEQAQQLIKKLFEGK